MTKEEIALQLTLAKLESLKATKNYINVENNPDYNHAIAEETVKLYNYIYENITFPSDK